VFLFVLQSAICPREPLRRRQCPATRARTSIRVEVLACHVQVGINRRAHAAQVVAQQVVHCAGRIVRRHDPHRNRLAARVIVHAIRGVGRRRSHCRPASRIGHRQHFDFAIHTAAECGDGEACPERSRRIVEAMAAGAAGAVRPHTGIAAGEGAVRHRPNHRVAIHFHADGRAIRAQRQRVPRVQTEAGDAGRAEHCPGVHPVQIDRAVAGDFGGVALRRNPAGIAT